MDIYVHISAAVSLTLDSTYSERKWKRRFWWFWDIRCLPVSSPYSWMDNMSLSWDFLQVGGWWDRERTSPGLWIIVIVKQKGTQWKTLLSPPTSSLSFSLYPLPISPLFPLLCYYHPDHYQAHSSLTAMERRASRPHGFGERFLTAAAQEDGVEGWEKNEDKRPNKVCLNIEAAGHFFPCPYKELLVNPGSLSSSLHWALITPSRIGTITGCARKHTQTHRGMLFYERQRVRGELSAFFFFSLHEGSKSRWVEHTKIGQVWGNLQKQTMGATSDGGDVTILRV